MASSNGTQSGIDVMGEIPSLLGALSKAILKGVPLLPAFLLIFGAVGYFASTQVDKLYEARAEIIMLSKRLEDDRAIITGSQRPLVLPPATQDLISETHILGSVTLIRQTIDRMSGTNLIKGEAGATQETYESYMLEVPSDPQENEDLIFEIAESLTVVIEPGSAVISITLLHTDPDFAVRFLEAHLDSYFEYRTDLTKDNSQIVFLTKRVDTLQDELAEINLERRATLDRSSAIDPAAEVELNWQTMRDELDRIGVVEARLRDLEASYRTQSAALAAWESAGEFDMPLGGGNRSSGSNNPGDANEYLLELHRELANARTRFNDTSDVVVEAQQRFQNAKASFITTLRQEVSALDQNVQALRSERVEKRNVIGSLRSQNESLSTLQGELAVLDTRLANTQLNLNSALTALENAQSVSATNSSLANVRVLQRANLTSLEPVSPNTMLFIASGAALGFFLCLLLSLILFTRAPAVIARE